MADKRETVMVILLNELIGPDDEKTKHGKTNEWILEKRGKCIFQQYC